VLAFFVAVTLRAVEALRTWPNLLSLGVEVLYNVELKRFDRLTLTVATMLSDMHPRI